MKFYAGIDLHANNNVLAVLNDSGQLVCQRRLSNVVAVVIGELERFQSALVGVVVESTFNWYWLVDGLQAAGYHAHLANTTAIQPYQGIKYTNDLTDARWLAEMLRQKILPEGGLPVSGRGEFTGTAAGWTQAGAVGATAHQPDRVSANAFGAGPRTPAQPQQGA